MLYLLLQETRDKDVYKVGYAKDLDSRFRQYQGHNYGIKLIYSRTGEFEDENLLHKYLHTFPEFWEFWKTEWYICEPDDKRILDKFMSQWSDIEERVWEKRSDLFNNKSDLDTDLYKRLYNSHFHINENNFIQDDLKFNPDIINDIQPEIQELNDFFVNHLDFPGRMCFYCQFRDQHPELEVEIVGAITVPVRYHEYYTKYGTARMKSVSYRESEFKRFEVASVPTIDEKSIDVIRKNFSVGESLEKKEIKSRIQDIYNKCGISKTAKALDINEYFNTKEVNMISSSTGKRIMGIKIISVK